MNVCKEKKNSLSRWEITSMSYYSIWKFYSDCETDIYSTVITEFKKIWMYLKILNTTEERQRILNEFQTGKKNINKFKNTKIPKKIAECIKFSIISFI